MGSISLSLFVAILLQVAASAPPPASAAAPGAAPASPQGAAAPGGQPAPGQPTQPSAPAPQPPPADNYTYNPDGRRDPFLSLLGTGNEMPATSRRGEGIPGMLIGEISVRGILQSRGTLIAMVQGPDNRTYMVRQGDKFIDGTVQSVTPEGLVIVQEVNDPLSLVKQRVVKKPLRSLEDVKQ
jgi:Tfp pilus assembly protein PilP